MPSKSSRQQNPPPKPKETVVGKTGEVRLASPEISSSDSALNKGAEFRPLPHVHYQRGSPVQHRYSLKSAELRRRSDTSLATQPSYSHKTRCKSDLEISSDSRNVHNYAEVSRRKTQTVPREVLVRQRRSVGHVTRGIAACDKVVIKQPTSRNIQGPESNPDWPVLCESDYENCGDSTVIDEIVVPQDKSHYGASMVTEGVKGLMKLLHHPFQCCQRKVSRHLVSFLIVLRAVTTYSQLL